VGRDCIWQCPRAGNHVICGSDRSLQPDLGVARREVVCYLSYTAIGGGSHKIVGRRQSGRLGEGSIAGELAPAGPGRLEVIEERHLRWKARKSERTW
jgi:hypothetical protein